MDIIFINVHCAIIWNNANNDIKPKTIKNTGITINSIIIVFFVKLGISLLNIFLSFAKFICALI